MNFCAAQEERRRVQCRERMFQSGNRHHFCTTKRRGLGCRLRVNGEVVSDPQELLAIWVEHLVRLHNQGWVQSRSCRNWSTRWQISYQSYKNEEMLLDTPFCAAPAAVRKFKSGKAAGPDGLLAEHLKWGGESVLLLLQGVLNFIVESEAVPSVLKTGILVPVYKSGGKDPLKVDSFQGVTLTSTLAKVLEFLIVDRVQLFLLEAGLPHVNQSAYQRGMSCAEAIFATQETIAQYMCGGNNVYMCLYDLEKAFIQSSTLSFCTGCMALGLMGSCGGC